MYKLTKNGIISLSDGVFIPNDPANKDYQEYLEWKKEGNEPEIDIESFKDELYISLENKKTQKLQEIQCHDIYCLIDHIIKAIIGDNKAKSTLEQYLKIKRDFEDIRENVIKQKLRTLEEIEDWERDFDNKIEQELKKRRKKNRNIT